MCVCVYMRARVRATLLSVEGYDSHYLAAKNTLLMTSAKKTDRELTGSRQCQQRRDSDNTECCSSVLDSSLKSSCCLHLSRCRIPELSGFCVFRRLSLVTKHNAASSRRAGPRFLDEFGLTP